MKPNFKSVNRAFSGKFEVENGDNIFIISAQNAPNSFRRTLTTRYKKAPPLVGGAFCVNEHRDSNPRLGESDDVSLKQLLASVYHRGAGVVVIEAQLCPSGIAPEQTALRGRASSNQTPMSLRSVSRAREANRYQQ